MQEIEFESAGTGETIQHSLKPLSSSTQDYINELLKNSEDESRNKLNQNIKKVIDKYVKLDTVNREINLMFCRSGFNSFQIQNCR